MVSKNGAKILDALMQASKNLAILVMPQFKNEYHSFTELSMPDGAV